VHLSVRNGNSESKQTMAKEEAQYIANYAVKLNHENSHSSAQHR
jgi:hypothetical protein